MLAVSASVRGLMAFALFSGKNLGPTPNPENQKRKWAIGPTVKMNKNEAKKKGKKKWDKIRYLHLFIHVFKCSKVFHHVFGCISNKTSI